MPPAPAGVVLPVGPVLGLALLAGAAMALQARINGGFALRLGNGAVAPVLAALASFAVGCVVVAAVVLASPAARSALRQARERPGSRPLVLGLAAPSTAVRAWMLGGGVLGAGIVATAALAVPVIGVALYTVGVVAGQTTGSLLVDRFGLGPGGRRPLSLPRLAGAALTVLAVALGAGGVPGPGSLLLLLLAAAAGAGLATQAAVNARLGVVLGDARLASLVSFVVGTVVLGLLAVALLAATDPQLREVPPLPLWAGGFIGAAYIVLTTAFVSRVGVLRWSLALVAGQLVGALLLDATAPVPGQDLTVPAVAGTLLTLVAVVVAGRPARGGAARRSTIGG